ncbi:MAG: LysM peptidoglycan-binding domain-containing protein [Muribaculaceae bacterium]|nr:LysM peptidoglycan-binding domain-containing protein [Muribaculaceae bacterium]
MNNIYRNILSAVFILSCFFAAAALDLPVKTVNGKQYFYHKVKKGESLYGISKSLGISIEDITINNPSAANGIKKGDLLVFPFEDYAQPDVDDVAVQEDDIAFEASDSAAADFNPKKPAIAVLMPFGLDKAEQNRQNQLAIDFYKGMMIAANEARNLSCNIEIVARDIDALSTDAIRYIMLNDSAVANASVIIAPDDDSAIKTIAQAAKENASFVFNTLNTRDASFEDNAYVFQANIQPRRMYELAVDALLAKYSDFHPVILRSDDGKNEKESFIEYLSERYAQLGIEPTIIKYHAHLLMSDLEKLQNTENGKFVVIPSSGSLAEFNKFAYTFKSFRDKQKALALEPDSYETPVEIEIFGYPDWTAFRGDALDTLHRIGATVYSRFLDDSEASDTKAFVAEFKKWYGASYIESIPAYGPLGYDTASFLLKAISDNDGVFDPDLLDSFSGVQSAFNFVKAANGFVNDSVYIIDYLPGNSISARIQ